MYLHSLRENFMLIMVWLMAMFISITCYIAMQNVFPSWAEILLAHTIYAIPALPNGFYHMVGFYPDYAAHTDIFFWLLAALYWVFLGAAHFWYLEERQANYMVAIVFLLMISSVRWLYFAEALIHAK